MVIWRWYGDVCGIDGKWGGGGGGVGGEWGSSGSGGGERVILLVI